MAHAVEDFLFVSTERVQYSFALMSPTSDPEIPYPMPEKNYHNISVFLLVALVDLVTWLGLTGGSGQGESPTNLPTTLPTTLPTHLPTPLPTNLPTTLPTTLPTLSPTLRPTLSPTLRPTLSPTLRPTLRPTLSPIITLIPTKYFTKMPLLQITVDDAKDGYQFCSSVSVSEGWSIVGAPYSNNIKGRACFYKTVLGAWDDRLTIKASNISDGDMFGGSVYINEKLWLSENSIRIIFSVFSSGHRN